jgi:hypothetical protein
MLSRPFFSPIFFASSNLVRNSARNFSSLSGLRTGMPLTGSEVTY